MGRLTDRVAIVTGAAQGIGAHFARTLAGEGAKVILCDVDDPTAAADSIKEQGGEALGLTADATSPESMAKVVRTAEDKFGGVHVLVNNAAVFAKLGRKPFEEITSDEWDRVMRVNTRGPFECAKAVLPVMRRQGYGKIINITSGTIFKGQVGLLHYVTSKGAVVAMTRALAREVGEYGIGVNALAPGLTNSENVLACYFTEKDQGGARTIATRCFQRPETPQDLSGALVFLASADSDFMTGQTIVVDGGAVMH